MQATTKLDHRWEQRLKTPLSVNARDFASISGLVKSDTELSTAARHRATILWIYEVALALCRTDGPHHCHHSLHVSANYCRISQKNDSSYVNRSWRPDVIYSTFRLIYKSLMENYLTFRGT